MTVISFLVTSIADFSALINFLYRRLTVSNDRPENPARTVGSDSHSASGDNLKTKGASAGY